MQDLMAHETETVSAMLRSDLSDEAKSARFERFVREHYSGLEEECEALAASAAVGAGPWWSLARVKRWWERVVG